MELRLQDIAAAASNSASYARGVEYYNQRRVTKLKVSPLKGGTGIKLTADVRGGKYSYEVELELEDSGGITENWCDCPAFYEYSGCCKHIIAVLLSYFYMHKSSQQTKLFLGEAITDRFADRMLTSYTKRLVSEAIALSLPKKVHLQLLLEYTYGSRFSLSLSVGHDRMYIIKDLGKFYNDMTQSSTVKYGIKLTLAHDESSFEDDSKELLRFFMSRYREFADLSGYMGQGTAQSIKRSMFISSNAFDELFGILKGCEVTVRVNYQREIMTTFIDENPSLELNIKDCDGRGFAVNLTEPSTFIYFGDRNQYVHVGRHLYRCDEIYTAATRDFLYALAEKGEELVINNEDMGVFCANVLRVIEEHIEINAGDSDITKFEPAQLCARLYLDMPSQGVITASLKFVYGQTLVDALDEDNSSSMRHDLRREYIARAVVDKYFNKIDVENKLLYTDIEENIYDLLSGGLSELSSITEVFTTDRFKRISIKKPPSVSVGVRLSGNLLDVDIDTGDFPPDELISLLGSYKQHLRYHKLRDGTFIALDNSALTGITELVEGLDLSKNDIQRGSATVGKYRALYIDNIIKNSGLIKSERDGGFKAMLRDIKDIDDADTQPPYALKDILRNYQITGFRWLKTMRRYGFGGILADDMGLGKTLQSIAFLVSNKEESTEHIVSMVVCPTSLVLNWESEINKFSPDLKPLIIIGSAKQRAELALQKENYDLVITSYELLRRDIALYEDFNFDCLILDESQYIKNSNALSTKAVKCIKSGCRFALTGTPVENSLAELWSVFDFLMQGYLYTHGKFRENFEIPIIKAGDEQAVARLRALVFPFILRRLKSSVLKELPPKVESVLYTKLSGEQERLYAANLASIKDRLTGSATAGQGATNKLVVLSMITRLRQLCCDPSLCYENYEGKSAKLELCMELVSSSTQGGHKLLLFSQFTSMLSIIEGRLKAEGISYYVLKGSTSKEERARLISMFNMDATQVFLISLKAGGTGLNLTAADIVIHYDPWWNLSVQNQATDRAHRIGQLRSVQVFKLIAKGTIEEKILKLQEEKIKLADMVISEGDGLVSGMSVHDILALFEE